VKRRRQWWRKPERNLLPRLRGRVSAPFSRDPRQLPLPDILPAPKRPEEPDAWPAHQTDIEDLLG
jgi:hypothetical protein